MEDAGEQDFERYVITPDVQYKGSRQTSEILTLFQLRLDAEYFQGKTNEPLPYPERFVYRNLTQEDLLAPQRGTCWVLKRADVPDELPPGWQVQDYGSYVILFFGA